MGRHILDEAHIHPAIRETIARSHEDIVLDVERALAEHRIVIVGMGQNPHPKKACRALDAKRIAYKYLEYGSYLSHWRRRNALKMWTGWPTFPMIFVDGMLVGGAKELIALLGRGELERMLAKPRG